MSSCRHDAALVHDGDPVGEVQRRAPVGDEQRGAALHDAPQGGVDPLFHPGVDRARGIVEDQDARVRQDGPGEGDPLPLASRQAQPSLADDGVVTLRQLFDERVRLGGACGRLHLAVCGGRVPVGDVRPHRVGEEEALLEDDADLAAQRGKRHVAHVVPVDAHGAGGRLVKARHHVRHGRLPAPARADQGHRLARGDSEAEPAQHRRALDIGVTDLVEDDLPPHRRQLERAGRVHDGRRRVEQLEDPLDAGPGLLTDCEDPRQHAGGRHELGQVGGESEKGPERDLVADRQIAPEGEDRHLAEAGHGLQEGLVARTAGGRRASASRRGGLRRRRHGRARGPPGRRPSRRGPRSRPRRRSGRRRPRAVGRPRWPGRHATASGRR